MKRVIGAAALFLMVLVGCKDEKSTDASADKPAVTEIETTNNYQVILDVIVKKDDNLSLFYTIDGTDNFFTIQPIWVNVKGSDNVQQATYNLPADVVPTALRLDFGLAKNQEDIVFKKITVKHLDKTFTADGSKIWDYFGPNPITCTVDKNTGVIKAIVKNGERQSPSLYPGLTLLGQALAGIK